MKKVFVYRGHDKVRYQGPHHEILTVGKVGDVHHAEKQGNTNGHQRPHPAGNDGVDKDVGPLMDGGQNGN